jgi:acetoin utilization protein AcuB
MRIDTWMKRHVITVKPQDTVLHARELLEKHRINQLPVSVDGSLVGIVTDRDLRDAFPSVFERPHRRKSHRADDGADPTTVPVEDVMSRKVVTMAPQALVADAARIMRRERIGAIPVIEGDRLVGILTRSDVLDALVELTGASAGG